MGKVYRARDTRLGREVALKVIIDEVAHDPSRLQRFEREARAVAALNHPNIVSLFDIGNADGTAYFVTELVQGESLRAVIQRGKLPLKIVLDIGIQVADGLAAAHAAGITHRDLKPENIMLTDEGRVKILDFGIARRSAKAVESQSDLTLPADQTEPGAIVGTVNYMSPEQAMGKDIDHRSDQFSFGLILYEMLAGRRAFDGPDAVHTMMAIINADPAPLAETVPPLLDWILEHCLDKDARHRYTSTFDLALSLKDVRDHLGQSQQSRTSEIGAPPSPVSPVSRSWRWVALTAVMFVLVGAAIAILLRPAPLNLSKYKFSPFATDAAGQCCAAWSPNGKAVAFIGSVSNKPRLYLRYVDSPGLDIHLPEIPHLEPGGIKAWSADSRKIFAATSEDNEIKLWRVPIVGGEPEQMEIPKLGEALALAPDGKTGATFMRRAGGEAISLWSFSLPGHELHRYVPDPFATTALKEAATLAFSPDGRKLLLMFAGDGKRQSWIIPWPPGSGAPKPVLPELDRIAQYHVPFGWMPDNRHIVLSPITAASWGHLYSADTESGRISQITMGLAGETAPSISPGGQRLIFEDRESDLNITSVTLADGKVSNLIATAASESMPSWSSRTKRLVYVSDRNGEPDIWVHDADGSDRVLIASRELPIGCISPMNPTLSPDGSRIVYTCVIRNEGAQLWIASLQGGTSVRLTNNSGNSEAGGSWSPDGKWFAYVEHSSPQSRLMRVKTTGEGAPVAIREAASYLPDWSPTSEWISYWQDGWNLTSPDGTMTRKLEAFPTPHVTFSADGKRLWFVCDEPERVLLISFDLESNKKSIVGDLGLANRPKSDMDEGIRFSISPDGKSLVYATRNDRRNLRMLEGFPQRPFGGLFR